MMTYPPLLTKLFLWLWFSLQAIPFPGPGGVAAAGSSPPTTNLKLWISADCITLSGGNCSTPSDGSSVSAWSDRSGNADDLTKVTGTCTFNTNQINSLPAVTLASCNYSLASNITAQCCHAVFVVLKITSNSGEVDYISGATGALIYYSDGTKYQHLGKQSTSSVGKGTVAADTTTWHQINVFYNNGVSPTFRLDRTTDTLISDGTPNLDASVTIMGLRSGGTAKFAEMLFYQSNDSGTAVVDKTTVETYLNNRYGL